MIKHRFAFPVGEADCAEFDVAFALRRFDRVGRLLDIRLRVQDRQNPVCTGATVLDILRNALKGLQRLVKQ